MKRNTNKRRKTSARRLREYIALGLVPNLGARRIRALLDRFGSARKIFRLPPDRLRAVRGIGRVTARQISAFSGWEEVDLILDKTERYGARILTESDPHYPFLLRKIYDPPLLLWVLGDPASLNRPGIAVVGTRRAGKYGLRQAGRFSAGLTRAGLSVVSGLAYGIDAAAHRAAVESGGVTVAVLGSGIDIIYPSAHRSLAREIVRSGGAVISEFPPGTRPEAGNFPARNRVVSGMTMGTLVVESGEKGGSMITAGSALDQNREVFAVPHEADTKTGQGGNRMIQRGWAKLVMEAEDLLEELIMWDGYISREGALPSEKPRWKREELKGLARRICLLLEEGPRHIDELCGELQRSPTRVLGILLELEMRKCVRQRAGRIFELA